jgi:hypothetical protein
MRFFRSYEAGVGLSSVIGLGDNMQKNAGKKKEKCKNYEGKGTLKKGPPRESLWAIWRRLM